MCLPARVGSSFKAMSATADPLTACCHVRSPTYWRSFDGHCRLAAVRVIQWYCQLAPGYCSNYLTYASSSGSAQTYPHLPIAKSYYVRLTIGSKVQRSYSPLRCQMSYSIGEHSAVSRKNGTVTAHWLQRCFM